MFRQKPNTKGWIKNEKTEKKFPITKNFLLASVTLKNPKVDFKDEKILIETDYNMNFLEEVYSSCLFYGQWQFVMWMYR